MSGGQANIAKFQELVKVALRNGFDLEMRSNLLKEAADDYKDDNLVNSCLLQFPFGRGGINERRFRKDGSITKHTKIKEYVTHLSLISQTQFHQQLFSLIMYNMHVKQEMVRTASYKTRGKMSATDIAKNLTTEELEAAINSKGRRRTGPGGRFLNAVDAIARAVPHTNEATKKARLKGEAIQHKFGPASYFLTITPDDDGNFLVQILSGIIVDDDQNIDDLSDAELAKRATRRTEIRLKFPGLCAFFFELVLDVIVEEVIGWDVNCENSRAQGGLFGKPQAFIIAVEEQG